MQASAPAAQGDLEGRGLIGVVSSEGLYHGDDMGYCLLVTRDAIVGAKRPGSFGDFEAYLGPGSEITDTARTKANKIAELVTVVGEFFIPTASIHEILLKRPGYFFGGYLIIRTSTRPFRMDMRLLSVGGSELLEASNALADSLEIVAGGRMRITRNPLPMTLEWPWASQSRIVREERLGRILAMLEEHKSGLSNAQIDANLSNYSQWTTIRALRELTTRGLIEYKPELFGDPGKYSITDLGVSTLRKKGS